MKKLKLITFIIVVSSICSCTERDESELEFRYEKIDSVWSYSPGTPHTLQTDFIYYGKTKSGIITAKRNSILEIGDSVKILYKSSN
jgi:hypothetical protein